MEHWTKLMKNDENDDRNTWYSYEAVIDNAIANQKKDDAFSKNDGLLEIEKKYNDILNYKFKDTSGRKIEPDMTESAVIRMPMYCDSERYDKVIYPGKTTNPEDPLCRFAHYICKNYKDQKGHTIDNEVVDITELEKIYQEKALRGKKTYGKSKVKRFAKDNDEYDADFELQSRFAIRQRGEDQRVQYEPDDGVQTHLKTRGINCPKDQKTLKRM